MLKYKIIKQSSNTPEGPDELFYPRLTKRNKYSLNDVARLIGRRSSLSKADIVAVLAAFEEIIPELLSEGSSVKLGDLGTFSLHARANATNKESEASWRNFKEVNIRFRAGEALKISLSSVNFEKVDD